ncbi:hypothetical protein OG871_38600 [Kitasatospora sp. NBC_00374]|uniref:hypothetical protein n=1 Tax=Kitasatospora sp. NBC_00374 TaxID=2975964 RepID=UPI0030E2A13C
MYVRTIYLTGDPALADKALEGLKAESVGLLSGQAGYRGFSIFSDRRLGKILLGSWWESAQNERDSYTALHDQRQELLTVFGGTVSVAGWEAAVSRRGDAQPGAGFRLVRLGFDPARRPGSADLTPTRARAHGQQPGQGRAVTIRRSR